LDHLLSKDDTRPTASRDRQADIGPAPPGRADAGFPPGLTEVAAAVAAATRCGSIGSCLGLGLGEGRGRTGSCLAPRPAPGTGGLLSASLADAAGGPPMAL
jgi:hypothetical protein